MEGRNFTICGKSDFTDIRQFNLMFETKRGVTDDSASRIFLRPENAQGGICELSERDALHVGQAAFWHRVDRQGLPQ